MTLEHFLASPYLQTSPAETIIVDMSKLLAQQSRRLEQGNWWELTAAGLAAVPCQQGDTEHLGQCAWAAKLLHQA